MVVASAFVASIAAFAPPAALQQQRLAPAQTAREAGVPVDWSLVRGAGSGAIFLIALVTIVLMMPMRHLPDASWQTTLGLGLLSAGFGNIPITALALRLVWFGSSAGVALSNLYPDKVRTRGGWLRFGWFVPVACVVGFFALLLASGGRA